MNHSVRPTDGTPLSRRTLIRGVGAAAAAVSGLAACTGPDAPAPPVRASGGGSVTAKTADIPVGGGRIYPDAQAVITQPSAGKFKAFSSLCTHAKCPVADVTTTINCQCHNSRFALADGSVVAGPAPSPLPARAVTLTADSVTVSA